MLGKDRYQDFSIFPEEQRTPFIQSESTEINGSYPPLPKAKGNLFSKFIPQRINKGINPGSGSASERSSEEMKTFGVESVHIHESKSHYNDASENNLDVNYYKNLERGRLQSQQINQELKQGQQQVGVQIRQTNNKLAAADRNGVYKSVHKAEGLLVSPHIGKPTFLDGNRELKKEKESSGIEETKDSSQISGGYQCQEYTPSEYKISEYKSIYDS
mmetsp:Transcript_13575/g.17880  ORF Transcript_13575/g.17880 Transcript_13575/m.17880 type:complete len:216 (-) Transcript_13575:326-973(-)